MKYAHILSSFAAEPWAMQREKLDAITAFLLFKSEGGQHSQDELAARVTNKRASEVARSEGAVAVIPVYGVLAQRMDMMMEFSGGTSYQSLARAIDAAYESDEIKAIVLDIDSPGGGVPGADEIGQHIRSLRGGDKPIVAQVNSLAASAAYWIASSADEIVVTPSGRAGSIGVYTSHDDVSEYLKQNGIRRTYIAAGQYKVEGNEAEPLDAEAKAYVQGLVNESYDKFVSAVAEGRGTTKAKVLDGFGQGRVFGAEGLIERGMADRIATLDETLARYGADARPERVRQAQAANSARAADWEHLVGKMRNGEEVTKREFEKGIRGSDDFSNAEAERAARLYFKDGQGEPDEADAATKAAVTELLAKLQGFKV